MVIFNKLEEFWDYIQEHTFDKLAEKVGVKYIEVEGIDYEISPAGYRVITATALTTLWKRHEDFDIKAKQKHPILFFLTRTYPDFISNIIYAPGKVYRFIRKYFKHIFIKQYNVVKTGLSVGYWDIDTRLVHAIKSLCFEFVEIECDNMFKACYEEDVSDDNQGLQYLERVLKDPNSNKNNTKHLNNIISVYNWFKVERGTLVSQIDSDDYSDPKLYVKLENELYTKDTKYCELFCKSREVLWT